MYKTRRALPAGDKSGFGEHGRRLWRLKAGFRGQNRSFKTILGVILFFI
jgi:hypothetical protein